MNWNMRDYILSRSKFLLVLRLTNDVSACEELSQEQSQCYQNIIGKKVQRSLSISKEEVNMYAKQLFFQVRVFESTLATTTVITHARDEKSKPL